LSRGAPADPFDVALPDDGAAEVAGAVGVLVSEDVAVVAALLGAGVSEVGVVVPEVVSGAVGS
jgi:hypothetical protein